MIIVKLTGGLGNQMFQYAIGKKLAIHQKTTLKADLSEYENDTRRKYELSCFNLNLSIATPNELNLFLDTDPDDRINKITNKICKWIWKYKYIKQPNFYFQHYPEVLNAPKNTYLEGYWQSEKYFMDIPDEIKNDFTFKNPLSKESLEVLNLIKKVNAISIHIRRGDYISNDTTMEFHGLCSKEYYQYSIDYIKQHVKDPHFFIFSDDPEWAFNNLKMDDTPVTFVKHNIGSKSYEDMQLMTLCKHNIIANSSFSWWGAWLNNNYNKIVIAPNKWFNPESRWFKQYKIDTTDILPESWIKLAA